MKVAVVTGGAGFIGSHLAATLLLCGYRVRVADTLAAGRRDAVPHGAAFHQTDVRNRDALIALCDGADTVFHLAALPRVEDSIARPLTTHDVNVNGVLSVLDAARATSVRRVIFASTCAIYGAQEELPLSEDLPPAPLSPYALHKLVGEQYLALFARLYGVSAVSLRLFNVYGPGLDPDGPYALVIGKFLKLAREGLPLTITGDGEQTRDFIHVHDVVRACIFAAESDQVGSGEVINVGTGVETSVNRLASIIGGERLYLDARREPRSVRADISRARRLLAWEPEIPLEEGIAELVGRPIERPLVSLVPQ